MQEHLEWHVGERGIFTAEQIDPVTGIITSWEKNLRAEGQRRKDAFPGGNPTRHIFEIEGLEKSYSIYDEKAIFDLSAELKYVDSDNKPHEFILGVSTRFEPDAFVDFRAHYSLQGNLTSFTLHLDSKKVHPDLVDQDLEGKFLHFRKRSLDENIKEVLDLFKYHGVTIFSPEQHSSESNTEEAQKDSMVYARMVLENKRWSDDDIQIAADTATWIVGITLSESHYELTPEQQELLTQYLVPNMLHELGRSSTLPASGSRNVYLDALKSALDWILSWYYDEIRMTELTYMQFSVTNNADIFNVATSDLQGNVLDEGKLKTGETYQYAEQQFTVIPSDNSSIDLSARSVLPNIDPREIKFPRTVNIGEYRRLVITQANKGWEEAFSLFELEYTKNDTSKR